MSVAKLIEKVQKDVLYWDMIKLVGYGGFRFHELASRMKPLVEKHGHKRVSAAMFELLSHTGWITKLSPDGRKAAWSVLGPRPEQWNDYYTGMDGKPQPRPEYHKEQPVIPEPQPDPILDGLTRKTATELDSTLRLSRAILRKKESPDHQRQLAEETIPRVESEMVRRGEPVPPEEKEGPKAEEKPKRTRKKKE